MTKSICRFAAILSLVLVSFPAIAGDQMGISEYRGTACVELRFPLHVGMIEVPKYGVTGYGLTDAKIAEIIKEYYQSYSSPDELVKLGAKSRVGTKLPSCMELRLFSEIAELQRSIDHLRQGMEELKAVLARVE